MKTKFVFKSVIAISVLLAFIFIPIRAYVVFYPVEENGESVLIPITQEGAEFSILYTHSIHLSDVLETYRITTDKEIEQTSLTYEDTSIGMPGNSTGNERFSQTEDGKYMISNMHRIFPEIYLRVGQVAANHRIVLGGKKYEMTHFFREGTLIKIQVQKLSLYKIWKGVTLDG